jgi:hypothetical protein
MFFLLHVSSLFAIYESVLKSFTHNVHLFVCCLQEHSCIVHTNYALRLGLPFPLCLLFAQMLLDLLHKMCTSLFVACKSAVRSPT